MSDLDKTRLSQWLAEALPGFAGIDALEKFPGGQSNPTYRLESAGCRYVLRRKPFGELLPSAHAVDREFRVLSALRQTRVPVPRPIALCRDASVIGSMFYLMEMVDGCTFWDGTLPNIRKEERRAYYESLTDTLAVLHSIDYIKLGLGDFGVSGNYVARQVQRWTKQYRAAQTDVIAEVEELIKWLPHTVPEQTGASIIHGDYRIDNVIFDVAGPRVQAVLDWELATIGDPLADFAYFAMSWTLVQGGGSGLGGVNLAEAGLPTLADIVARYCAATGREALPALHWYFAYNLFRLVGIIQGIKKRVADGNASSAAPAETLALLQPYARTAWKHARLAGA